MRTIEFDGSVLRLLDQTLLPQVTRFAECRDVDAVADAIRSMKVRGAPAIGVSAAYGMVLAALQASGRDQVMDVLRDAAALLKGTRPTAVNLAWAVDRCLAEAGRVAAATAEGRRLEAVQAALHRLADDLAADDVRVNRTLGAFGAELIPDGARVLTHCNAGALACVDYGTALGVVRGAVAAGKRIHVLVDETRPFLQGARLTAWELQRDGIPLTLISDNMAGYFFSRGQVDAVVVGADRVAANGDVANKIGTYTLAVLAHAHGIPFYAAVPTSTIDLSVASGELIPIEERSEDEVTHVRGVRVAPEGVRAAHPAFDVTPARLVTAIITEDGVCRGPYQESLRQAVEHCAGALGQSA
ncbi:MAG: S-methyl-5-thioribose-1-phosphate isomerase [Chloroflexota bacterium]